MIIIKNKETMTTLKLETGKGLQSILIDILNPIKMVKSEGSNKYTSVFEFIGTVDNPIQKLKDHGKGVYESVTIIEVL